MTTRPDTSQLGSRPRVTGGGQSPRVSHSRHSAQGPGHQPADRAAYEQSNEKGRAQRRQPGPVDEEA